MERCWELQREARGEALDYASHLPGGFRHPGIKAPGHLRACLPYRTVYNPPSDVSLSTAAWLLPYFLSALIHALMLPKSRDTLYLEGRCPPMTVAPAI